MSNGKATASFFENGSTSQFEYCFKLYPEVLKLKAEKRSKKPQELIRLDAWYQNELPGLIKARGKDAHMVYDELVQTMKWKQSRGKFYPQLSYLVKVNTPRAVVQETKKAFRKLPNLEQAITALSNLKGVGTTMASALLAAAAPHSAPFMADECLMAIPEIEGIDYTTKEYLNFVQHIQSTVERLNAEVGGETPHWSPHRVELALWAHYVANDLSPELLDDMPPPGVINTNGSLNNNGEDTNDGVAVDLDDESLGAGGRNTATESETENENTNPTTLTPLNSGERSTQLVAKNNTTAVGALQDGDSNFVSNDSTSQEPIIDDNTTQTTATTSTEDGEPIGGTPLASDSESNLEAPPLKANNHLATGGDAQPIMHNNNRQTNNNGQSAGEQLTPGSVAPQQPNGNGNGVIPLAGSDNGPNSGHCGVRINVGVVGQVVEEDDDDDDDDVDDDDDLDDEEDDELEADESNSSSSRNMRATNANASASAAASANVVHKSLVGSDGTSLTVVPSIGQKRTVLHCDLEVNANAGVDTDSGKSPELKKLRSD
ncbi:probable serine/threonine-protein kinase ifkB isoform X2 [Scaptodrosophila lebanonensis]|uniref:Probable serine/threonine-protein kinase ifkB isoform X2 n=1 Tax=Drosophila lebanonensis TaxID=7225 RepID=A0A6J2TXS5_DROLE|nr:probable serine/threonine-protein kinase ifkB isoform X2 [Scaptodrosophila lebanonensis]